MSAKNQLPTHIAAALSSNGGETGTTYFAAYVLDVDPALQEKIDRMWEIVDADNDIHSISINVSGIAMPGSDNDGASEQGEENEERLEEIVEDLQEGSPRPPSDSELEFFKKMVVGGCRGERLVITKYSSPYILCHEKYGYEEFSSSPIEILKPEGLRKQHDEAAAQREAAAKEQQATRVVEPSVEIGQQAA